jgi:hypothetical protein
MTGPRPFGTSLLGRGLTLAAGAALVGGVAACSPENIAEKVIEAGSDGQVDVNIDEGDGSVTIEGEDGTATFGGSGALPDGFPDAVPVVKGDISYSQSMSGENGTSYSVLISVSGTVEEVFTEVTSDMTGAGFKIGNETTVSSGEDSFASASFTSSQYEALVNVTPGGDGSVAVTYIVSPVAP